MLLQLRGIIEFLVTRFNWLGFRTMTRYPEEFPTGKPVCRGRAPEGRYELLPRQSRDDVYQGLAGGAGTGIWHLEQRRWILTENQMRDSQKHVNGPWRYTRIEGGNHWMQLDVPDKLNPPCCWIFCNNPPWRQTP